MVQRKQLNNFVVARRDISPVFRPGDLCSTTGLIHGLCIQISAYTETRQGVLSAINPHQMHSMELVCNWQNGCKSLTCSIVICLEHVAVGFDWIVIDALLKGPHPKANAMLLVAL